MADDQKHTEAVAKLKAARDNKGDDDAWAQDLPDLPDLPEDDEATAIMIPSRKKGTGDSSAE